MFSSECAPQLSNAASKVQWLLRFAFSYVRPVTQQYRRKTVEESASATIPDTTKYDDSRVLNYQLLS